MKLITKLLMVMSMLVGQSFAQESILNVGIEGVDLKPAIGIPLAGYGSTKRRLPKWDWKNKYPHSFFFKPSEGVRDPIRAKAMVIEKDGEKLLFLSLDVIGVTKRFVRDLSKKLKKHGIKKDHIFVSATHTHSGPGTLTKRLPLALVAVDLYKKRNYEYMVEKVYETVVSAINNLQPAELYKSSFLAQDIQQNKFRKKGQNWFNNEAKFLLAKSKLTGEWMGGMLNFAVHGNAMPIEDMRYSADFPGALEKFTEDVLEEKNLFATKRPTIVFMNGAEGDVRHKGDRGEEIMDNVAKQFAEQAKATALQDENMTLVEPNIKLKRRQVNLGLPRYPLRVCMKKEGHYKEWMKFVFKKGISIYPFMPRKSFLSMVQVGDILMMTWPGEASTSLGWQLQDMAKAKGYEDSWVLGLTNGYMTYFTNKEEFYEAEYDSCSSFYGHEGGQRIIDYYSWALDRF